MTELMNEMNAQMAEIAAPVQMWINWMMVVFMASLIFVWKHKLARYVLGLFILTMVVGMGVFKLTDNVHLLGIAHLICWIPILVLIIKDLKAKKIEKATPFGVWIFLLKFTIIISLVFDVRDIVLVLTGHK